MTYLEQAVATVADIPAAIVAFAEARGWTVGGLAPQSEITRPGGGKTFSIAAGGTATRPSVFVTATDGSGMFARIYSPRRNGTQNAPIVLAPTKLHLFGNEAPFTEENPPYVAVAIEFGFNNFRHLYIGNMVKMGDYEGGEIISANQYAEPVNSNTNNPSFTSVYHKYLFSANHAHQTDAGIGAGGVNIEHVDNAQPWRYFDGPTGTINMYTNFNGREVFGGWQDVINSSLASSGIASYSASNILVPVNLYVPVSGGMGSDYRFRPIGHVPGVRLVRMDGIDPGEQIEVANKNWMVFPEFSRDLRQNSPRDNSLGFYWDYETSYLCGLAYAMD